MPGWFSFRVMRQSRSRGSAAPTVRHAFASLYLVPVDLQGSPYRGGDLFGNASSFKTINRDNFINFAAEISPDLGRVILIRSAGSRRGTSGAAWIRCGMGEKETDRGRREGKRRKRRYDDDPRTPPPWDLSPFTTVEIRSPTLLIYRYLDTYTLTGVVF